jgi:hypothetical protein
MSLPMNTTTIYTLEIPSLKKTVKYRPFLVREEKALLIAQQSEDPDVMINTLKEIISGCIKDKIEVEELATFDIEYIFTQIRAKSVGEVIELIFSCDEDHGDENEKAKVKISFDLTKINVEVPAGHSKKISLFGDVGLVMKYPTINVIHELDQIQKNDIDAVFSIIAKSIDYIYSGDELHYAKEQTKEELLEFLNNLTSEQFGKIQTFFQTMPSIKKEVDYKCPVCGKEHHATLQGLSAFF